MNFEEWSARYRQTRNYRRRKMVTDFQYGPYRRWFPWMQHPVLHYITSFWIGLIDEGPYSMLKPRWGGITFGWLNDGIKPTAWHTWRQLTHDHRDPFCGIYVSGAPKSLRQAEEWRAKWDAEREAA